MDRAVIAVLLLVGAAVVYLMQLMDTVPPPLPIELPDNTLERGGKPGTTPVVQEPEYEGIRPRETADGHRSKELRVLDKLEETCRFWRARGTAAALAQAACGRMERFAEARGLGAPAVPRTAPVAASRRGKSRRTAAGVSIPDCSSKGRGSLAYRRCRSEVYAKLRKKCSEWSARFDRAAGAARREAREQRRAWCRAYRSWSVVD